MMRYLPLCIVLLLPRAFAVDVVLQKPPTASAVCDQISKADGRGGISSIYFLPEAELDVVEAYCSKLGTASPGVQSAVSSLLARGRKYAHNAAAEIILRNDEKDGDFVHGLKFSCTPTDLTPLCDLLVPKVSAFRGGRMPLWVSVAVISAHPGLVARVVESSGVSAKYREIDADTGALLAPVFEKASEEKRIWFLQLLRPGFKQAPPPEFVKIFKDRSEVVRMRFMHTLRSSTHPAAMDLLQSGLKDGSTSVQKAAIEAILQADPEQGAAILKSVALDETIPLGTRLQCIEQMTAPPSADFLDKLQLQFLQQTDGILRRKLAAYLARNGRAQFVLDRAANKVVDRSIVTALIESAPPSFHSTLLAFLQTADPSIVNWIAQSAATPESRGLPVLVELLKDARGGIAVSAENTLSQAAHCDLTDEERRSKPEIRYALWKEWVAGITASDDLQHQADLVRSSLKEEKLSLPILDFDPLPALQHLCYRQDASNAVRQIARLPGRNATMALLRMLQNPGWRRLNKFIADGLLQRPFDQESADIAMRGLSSADVRQRTASLRLLVRWHYDPAAQKMATMLPELAEAVLPSQAQLLAVWQPEAVIQSAEAIVANSTAPSQQRVAAAKLLSVIKGTTKHESLAAQPLQAPLATSSINVLVASALDGSEAAQTDLATRLNDHDVAPVRECITALLAALDPQKKNVRLPGQLCRTLREFAAKNARSNIEAAGNVFAVLAQAGDIYSLQSFQDAALESYTGANVLFDCMSKAHPSKAAPFLEAMLRVPAITEKQRNHIAGVLRTQGMPDFKLAERRSPLQIELNLGALKYIHAGVKDIPLNFSMKNISTATIKFKLAHSYFYAPPIPLPRQDITVTWENGAKEFIIEPGKTVTGKFKFDGPPESAQQAQIGAAQLHLQWVGTINGTPCDLPIMVSKPQPLIYIPAFPAGGK
jgi:hypothetical protein